MILKQTQFEEIIGHKITDEQYLRYLNICFEKCFNDIVKRCEEFSYENTKVSYEN